MSNFEERLAACTTEEEAIQIMNEIAETEDEAQELDLSQLNDVVGGAMVFTSAKMLKVWWSNAPQRRKRGYALAKLLYELLKNGKAIVR